MVQGHPDRLKLTVSPVAAAAIVARNDPAPASFVLSTVKMAPRTGPAATAIAKTAIRDNCPLGIGPSSATTVFQPLNSNGRTQTYTNSVKTSYGLNDSNVKSWAEGGRRSESRLAASRERLIVGRVLFDLVDHDQLDRPFALLQLQPEFLQAVENRPACRIGRRICRSLGGRLGAGRDGGSGGFRHRHQILQRHFERNLIFAFQLGLVDYRPVDEPR